MVEEIDDSKKSTVEGTPEEDYSLQEPLDYTDPMVYHDPTINFGVIVKHNDAENAINQEWENMPGEHVDHWNVLMEGVQVPLVYINARVIQYSNIKSLKISYRDFWPSIDLIVYDPTSMFKFGNVPGLNNTIRVIFRPAIDGAYKSVVLNFDIIDHRNIGDYYSIFKGEYKLLEFKKRKIEQIQYPGCSNVRGKSVANGDAQATDTISCNSSPNPKPNMWELLHSIAIKCGLGFASTDKCKDIQDRLPRNIFNLSYKKYIEYCIERAGLDEDSIFDCWIDLYGYIVMVNLPWIFNNEIDYRHLSIKAMIGANRTSLDFPEPKWEVVHRTLTNSDRTQMANNLLVTYYEDVNDIDSVFSTGILQRCNFINTCNSEVEGTINSCFQLDVAANALTNDDINTEEYTTENELHINHIVDEYNTGYQKNVRDKYLQTLNEKTIKVKMANINFGLQRGTLVNFVWMEEDSAKKHKIMTESSRLGNSQEEKPDKIKEGDTSEKEAVFGQFAIPNPAISGLYYIAGMEFVYEDDKQENNIIQYLYLIKKGYRLNYDNTIGIAKLDADVFPSYRDNKLEEVSSTIQSDPTKV